MLFAKTNHPVNVQLPERFLIPNGRKCLQKEAKHTSKNSQRYKKILELLELPVIPVRQQDTIILPGNGFYIKYKEENEKIFCILDGTEKIKEHKLLPDNTSIVLSSEPLGKNVIGKTEGTEVKFKLNKEEEVVLTICSIVLPSEAKWPLHYK